MVLVEREKERERRKGESRRELRGEREEKDSVCHGVWCGCTRLLLVAMQATPVYIMVYGDTVLPC